MAKKKVKKKVVTAKKRYALTHIFGTTVAIGTKRQVEMVYKAFETYGIGMHKFNVEEKI